MLVHVGAVGRVGQQSGLKPVTSAIVWDLSTANPAAGYETTENGTVVSPASNLASRYAIKADVVITGKAYWELQGNGVGSAYDNAYYGVCPSSKDFTADTDIIGDFDGVRRQGNVYTRTGDTSNVGASITGWAFTDIIQFAIDVPNQKLWLGINNVWVNSGDPNTGANPTWTLNASVTEWTPCASVEKAIAELRLFSTAEELTFPLEGFTP